MRTCWYQVKNFNDIGNYLKKKYVTALKAKIVKRKKGKKYQLKVKVTDKQRKDELVYVDDSPSYCRKRERYHSLGTVGRQCDANATDQSSCKKLCCDRGYKTVRKVITEKCECKFIWCCVLKCKTCRREVSVNICN